MSHLPVNGERNHVSAAHLDRAARRLRRGDRMAVPVLMAGALRLLDHLVRDGQQRFGDGKAERLGGLHVDDEFELSRLLDR